MTVTLREVEPADLPLLFEHQRDPAANEMAAFPAREEEAFMTHWREKVLGDPSVRVRTIVFEGVVAGNVLSWKDGDVRFVGYWIAREHWGRGIASMALSAFLRDIAERPLRAYVASHNAGSIRVLEKNGFVRVGDDADGLFFELA